MTFGLAGQRLSGIALIIVMLPAIASANPAQRRAIIEAVEEAEAKPVERLVPGRDGLSGRATLGKSVFFDADLSSRGNQSCAFCHTPETGFTSPREDFNMTGSVVEGSIPGRFGNAKPPTITYMSAAPVLHHRIEDGETLFVGGAFWNGRATGKKLGTPVADQALQPFLNPLEMALPDAACVVRRVCSPQDPSTYPVRLTDLWGEDVCRITYPADIDARCADPSARIPLDEETRDRVEDTFSKVGLAVAAYEASSEINPFSSKFDMVLAGKAAFTEIENRGYELFKGKGLCANCHVLDAGPRGEPPLLTDFTYDNLGVPRNPDNPFYKAYAAFNPDGKSWVDAGLGATLEKDPIYAALAKSQMGKVKVPTLRNVDRRPSPSFVKAFMHNGYFKSLKSVVHFYNTRDVKPRCNDPMTREEDALRLGCWPEPEVADNLNTDEMGDLQLTEEEEKAIVAFMKTLSDGFEVSPEHGAAEQKPAQSHP